MGQYARMMTAGSVLAVLFFVLSLSVGRFYVPFDQVVAILALKSPSHGMRRCITSSW